MLLNSEERAVIGSLFSFILNEYELHQLAKFCGKIQQESPKMFLIK
jgi:hypothetical protein